MSLVFYLVFSHCDSFVHITLGIRSALLFTYVENVTMKPWITEHHAAHVFPIAASGH